MNLVKKMNKNIGFFTTESNSEENGFFSEVLKEKYDVAFFNWYDYAKASNIEKFYNHSDSKFFKDKKVWDINDFDLIHVLAMGQFKGREKEVNSFFYHLNNLKNLIIINRPSVMIKNLDKSYLLNLQEKGIPTIPTLDISKKSSKKEILQNLKEKFCRDIEDVVLKPKYFGERSNSVVRLSNLNEKSLEKYYEKNNNWGVLAQEFISTIIKDNEKSLIYVETNFSHAVMRYKERNGWLPSVGENARKPKSINTTKDELRLCERVLETQYPDHNPITRFDLIGSRNFPMISEVEEINPSLYLNKISSKQLDNFMMHYKNALERKLS